MPQFARENEPFDRASFPSRKWTSKDIQKERHELKRRALDLLGGKCCKCGYKGVALDFHHRDPKTKKITISEGIFMLMPWTELKQEVRKCILLCANHHRELHH